MDKITLPELPVPHHKVKPGEIYNRTTEEMQRYARACCKHVLELAAKECDKTGPDDWTGENCARIVRDLIGKL